MLLYAGEARGRGKVQVESFSGEPGASVNAFE